MHVYVHVCTQTHTIAGKAVFIYFVVLKFLSLCLRICPTSTTDTYIYTNQQTWSEDKSTHSCCSFWIPCNAKDPLSFALSSLSLGISSGDIEVGSTFTKRKKKKLSRVGYQIYALCASFIIFRISSLAHIEK